MCDDDIPGWNVESVSVVMFRHLVEENDLRRDLRVCDIGENEMKFIEALMDPDVDIPEDMEKFAFLRKVVRDPVTSVDAVTMDSIARDSYLLNIPSSFDHKRLIQFVRLNKPKRSDKYVLCYREKEAHDLYSMFLSRLNLQTKAYKHKTVQLMEHMLKQALLKADEHLKLTETAGRLLSADNAVRTEAAKKYTRLTDYVMDRIMESNDQALRESQQIWQEIQKRELMKFIGSVQTSVQAQLGHNALTIQDLRSKLEQLTADAGERDGLRDCLTLMVEFQFGTEKCDNPVEKVYFYHKSAHTTPILLKREQVSKILPDVFTEVALRVYHKRVDGEQTYRDIAQGFQQLIQEKYSEHLKWMGILSQTSSPSSPEPSPS
jgi:HD superfamily phosphohydrolase